MVSNIFWNFHPECLGKWSNLTCAYFSNGLVKRHQLVYIRNLYFRGVCWTSMRCFNISWPRLSKHRGCQFIAEGRFEPWTLLRKTLWLISTKPKQCTIFFREICQKYHKFALLEFIPPKINKTINLQARAPYSHTIPIRIPWSMGIVWEAYGKGVQLLRVPRKIPNVRSKIWNGWEHVSPTCLFFCTLNFSNQLTIYMGSPPKIEGKTPKMDGV